MPRLPLLRSGVFSETRDVGLHKSYPQMTARKPPMAGKKLF